MSAVSRSVKNVFRNTSRTIMVIFIISLCICVYLSMTIVNGSISETTMNISENLDTTITIRPAGEYGGGMMPGMASSTPIDESVITVARQTDHVATVQVFAMATEESAVYTTRQGMPPGGMNRGTQVLGEIPGTDLVLMGGGSMELLSGRSFVSSDADDAVAYIGSAYRNETGAAVGSTIELNGTYFEVIGIFTTGSMFGDSSVIIPYEVFKDVYAVEGPSMLYVTASSVGYVDSVVDSLKTALGGDYDVVALADMDFGNLGTSIEDISANSELGALVALVTAGAVMVFVMILVTRERMKEIGVLKALGFRNSKIVTQFIVESMTLATIGFVIGIIMTVVAGPYISAALLQTSSVTSSVTGGPGGGFGGRPGVDQAGSSGAISEMDFTISLELALFSFAMVMVLGIIGSLYPTFKAMKLQPAEALKYDE